MELTLSALGYLPTPGKFLVILAVREIAVADWALGMLYLGGEFNACFSRAFSTFL